MENNECIEASDDKLNLENMTHNSSPAPALLLEYGPHVMCDADKGIIEGPKLGKEFGCYESAYQWYTEYGRTVGFDVRKNLTKTNSKGIVTRVIYCCSKEGFKKEIEAKSYSQPITRVGCKAHMTCQIQKNGKFRMKAIITIWFEHP